MIKIYTDTNYITPQYRKIIFPLLLELCYIRNLNLLKEYQFVDTIKESDVVIVPVQIAYFYENNKVEWLYDFIDEAKRLEKKVWVYSAGDFGFTLQKDVYTFRLGGFESKLDAKTFIVPALIMDPYLQLQREFQPIPKTALPRIGFVGHADGSKSKWGKEYLIFLYHNFKRISKQAITDYQPFYPSSTKRYHFLSGLKENKQIETNFIYRKHYRAGAKTEEEKKMSTLEFFENMAGNPYVFCLRGVGNFSIRFYEALAMGRIPFVIDTDFRLPLDTIINWEKHCIIVSENNYMDVLIHFHKKISEKDFERMQINNRNLWLNDLSREAYFRHIHSIFKT